MSVAEIDLSEPYSNRICALFSIGRWVVTDHRFTSSWYIPTTDDAIYHTTKFSNYGPPVPTLGLKKAASLGDFYASASSYDS